MRVLIGADELARQLGGATPPVVLDVRWKLFDDSAHERYLEGHIPGAVFVDLDRELAAEPSRIAGRHPMPSAEQLQANARKWGIRNDSVVVVYDETGGQSASRAWWLLRWAGFGQVYLLDGGLPAWTAGLETGSVNPEPGNVTLSSGHMPVVDAAHAAELPGTGTLIDARTAERFRGEQEPVDPIAGHIPGALCWPVGETLENGRMRSPQSLLAHLASMTKESQGSVARGEQLRGGSQPSIGSHGPGVNRSDPAGAEIAVYCGSGVQASHVIAALATAGIEAALYPGSWSEWIGDPSHPIATTET